MANRVYSSPRTVVTSQADAFQSIHNAIYNPVTTLSRPAIFDILISSSATPADNVVQWAVERTTGVPTGGTAITCLPVDSNDPAASTLGISKPTSVMTAGVVLMYMSVNQRVTWRWCAVPGGELVNINTASAGIGLASLITATPFVAETVIFFRE